MSTGGAKHKVWGPYDDGTGAAHANVWIKAYDAGAYSVAKAFWTQENKAAGSVTELQGDATGTVAAYFDGDYNIEILESDKSTVIKQYASVNVTGDFGTNYETQYGTAIPAASANNKGMTFVKIDGSNNVLSISVSNGSSFTTIFELTTAGLPSLDNLATAIMPVANVKHPDYGAVGDGSTDDTAAIQAAIDAIEAGGGGIVWLPEGTYKTIATLQIGQVTGNIIFRGAGKGASIIKTAHASNDILRLGDGSTTRSDITVMHLTFDSSVTRSGGAAITLDKVQDCTLDNIKFDNQFNSVDTSASNSTVYMINFTIKDTVASNGTGITLSHGNDYYIDTFIMDTSISQPKAGIFMDSVTNVFIDNAHILNAGTGIYLEPGAGETVSNVFVSSCKVNGCDGNNMLINANTATSTINTVKVSSSLFASSSAENGIKITGDASSTLDDIELGGVDCYENLKHGIFLAKGLNLSCNLCTCSGNDTGDSDTYSGIAVSGGVKQFYLTNNTCGVVAAHDNYQNYGIQVAAGAGDEYIIMGNSAINNKNGSITDGGTGKDKIVKDNLTDDVNTLTADATVALPVSHDFFRITAATAAIDNITGGFEGRAITIINKAGGAATFNDASGGAGQLLLDGSANFASGDGNALNLIYSTVEDAWFEHSKRTAT